MCSSGKRNCGFLLLEDELNRTRIATLFLNVHFAQRASQVALMIKNLPANAGDIRDVGLILESGISPEGMARSPEGGHGDPLQYSCLENPHGQRSLEDYSPCSHKELDTREVT